MTTRWTRRDFLKESGLGAASISLASVGCEPSSDENAETMSPAGETPDDRAGLRDELPRKPNIAIVGGGPAGLSAAFHLTREKDWNRRYDVTVYQLGWRLGGKGATGRNEDKGWRIEEHGIHGFCRFYFNTWKMMKEVYTELHPDDRALLAAGTLEEAFLPSSVTYSVEFRERWRTTVDYMPIRKGEPWDDEEPDLGLLAMLGGALRGVLGLGRRDDDGSGQDDLPPDTAGAQTKETAARLLGEVETIQREDPSLDRDAARLEPVLDRWIRDLDALTDERARMDDLALSASAGRSRMITTADFYLAVAKGLAKERWKALRQRRPWDLDDLDDVDYRDWLREHGASKHTLSAPISLAIPNILFAYPKGDSTQPPRLSAASFLNWVGRSLLGRGEYFYFMQAGTGESVVLPLYLLLKRRGVKFEFFHKLVGMRSGKGAGKELSVEELHFEEQASIDGGGPYDPLRKLPGRGYRVWPNQPRWDQLAGVEKTSDRDFEAWSEDGLDTPAKTLVRGTDFDYVVWAMPPSMIPLVGDEALKRTWKAVNEHLPTTATQAVQLWLTADTQDLGWPRAHLKPDGTARYGSGTFPNPLNGCVAFDDLIDQEAWGSDGPKGLLYLCSQLHTLPGQSRDDELTRVRSTVNASVRLMGNFLTKGRAEPPDRVDPQSLDYDLLYDPTPGHTGAERLGYQYVRTNSRPTEAYVQAPPKGLLGRLDAWDSGYENLVPAGDWIRTGFNLGSFESAVTGGKLAAFALTGSPKIASVVGYRLWHGHAGGRIRQALMRGPRIPVKT